MADPTLDLLRALSEAFGPPGHEDAVRRLFAREVGGDLRTDRVGSVMAELPGTGPRVLLESHLDEVGFAVRLITPEGFLKLTPLGSWWGHTLPAQRVRILTRRGEEILGVITSKPPHFLSEDERATVQKPEQLFVDVGASSAAQASREFGLAIGDPVVPDTAFTTLRNGDLLLGKAFDNRAGTGVLIQALQQLRRLPHPNTLVGVGAVQEEVGARGARCAAALAKPDIAIVLEGAPADDTPGCPLGEAQGALGRGPQIRLLDPTALMNRPLAHWVIELAAELGLPHQIAVRTSGGTDASALHLYDLGVPTVVIGVPARYIHTHQSIIHRHDYHATLQLVLAIGQRLDAAVAARCTDFLGG
jgi:endoglucanase